MTKLAQFFNDPRRRNLVVLAALALVSIGAAFWSMQQQAPQDMAEYTPAPLLPGFAQVKDRATKIRVTTDGTAFDIIFSPEKGWIIPQRHSYPASFEQIRKLLKGLATLQKIAPKTSHKDWLTHLDLGAPETGGKGIGIRVSDESGATLADIVIGKREKLDDGSGQDGFYARKTGENQSWLVRSDFRPSGDTSTWLDKSIPAIAVGRVSRMTIEPIAGPSFTVWRSTATDPFKMLSLPPGRELADPAAPNDIGTLLPDFDFDDARAVTEVDFTNAPRASTHTFDGLNIVVETTRMGAYFWSRVTAEGKNPAAQQEARTITSRTAGWAYRLTPERGQRFFTTLERMLAPAKTTVSPEASKRLAPPPLKK